MRTSFNHQSEAQPPNGPLTAATSPNTPSAMPSHAVFLTARFPGDGQEAHKWRALAAAFRSPRRPFLA